MLLNEAELKFSVEVCNDPTHKTASQGTFTYMSPLHDPVL